MQHPIQTFEKARSGPVSASRGFTLIELLVAVGIIGLIASLAVRAYVEAIEKARVTRAITDIRTLEKTLEPLEIDGTSLPTTLAEVGWTKADPWDRPYVYLNFETVAEEDKDKGDGKPKGARRDNFLKPLNTRYDLYSLGQDGETKPQLNNKLAWDDVLRAADGVYVGLASEF